jgi:hypothetical protein
MGSKIPRIAMARAAKAKAAKAKATKPDATKPTATRPTPPKVSIEPPTPTTSSFPSDLPRADINAPFLPSTWFGQGELPVVPSKRAAMWARFRAVIGPEILAQLQKLAKLKEGQVFDAEEKQRIIDQLGRLMEERVAKMDDGDEGMKERIASLMADFKTGRL